MVNSESYILLNIILKKVELSEHAFKWLVETPYHSSITLLVYKKKELDVIIENKINVCKKEGYTDITIRQFNCLLEKVYPSIEIGFKIYVFELLLDSFDSKYYPYYG